MAVDTSVADKEVLAFLIRVNNAAQIALKNLNNGNPYDAVRLMRVIAKLDIGALNVLANVPNYEVVRPYHIELVNECKAILALSQTAINEVSPELKTWSPERIARVKTTLQEALGELDKELKAEREVARLLQEAEKAFLSREKAWTYSRLYLEKALHGLDLLVRDETTMKQSVERFSKVFKGVKHQDTKKLLNDLIGKRLKVRAVVKFIFENAFERGFTFQGHDWFSELRTVSGLPEENINELEAIRQQLLGSTAFAKGNVNYLNIRQLLEKLVSLSQHARRVERALELVEQTAKEHGKTEEELLREYWESRVYNGYVYHGTSSIFLPNIERFGLSSEQIFSEGTPFRPEDYNFFLEISRRINAPYLKYFTDDVTRGFFLDTNHGFAVNYAKQGPERIRFMIEHIRGMEEEFRQGVFAGKVSQQEIYRLLQILRQYEQTMSYHKPVVLHIPIISPALLTVLRQNGEMETLAASLISDVESFKRYVKQEFSSFMTFARQQGWTEFSDSNILKHVQKANPLERFFHNRPLKGTIPWAGIAKVEQV